MKDGDCLINKAIKKTTADNCTFSFLRSASSIELININLLSHRNSRRKGERERKRKRELEIKRELFVQTWR